jgi:hypothetical protein
MMEKFRVNSVDVGMGKSAARRERKQESADKALKINSNWLTFSGLRARP